MIFISKDMKKCAILGCPNTEASVPIKFLFCAPRDYATRGLWIQATGKDYSHSSMFFVCEDHFDLTKDVDYYNASASLPNWSSYDAYRICHWSSNWSWLEQQTIAIRNAEDWSWLEQQTIAIRNAEYWSWLEQQNDCHP
ncbi:hypothetical protein Bhyg_07705 [Pseudolycoriella hygida]|uniref:THAP-type domain-containing protein n=1 Tax=Pseudolycoriella hygida TaxID=35572 RepID=A0A9Q0N3H9_9DIPT|nr:hypothetical protein Bhyg_07705 [Pseudolycoriella hygida]